MSKLKVLKSRFCIAALWVWVVAGCLPGFALQTEAVAADVGRSDPIFFNIAAQPLNSALAAYGAATGMQMLYNSALVDGRWSKGVTGGLAPEEALGILLAGSDLVARRTDIDAMTIERMRPEQSVASADVVPDARFLGALQAAILGALCLNPEARPGSYRVALQLWVSPDGSIQRVRLLGSAGNARRDMALVGALENVGIGMPMPTGVPQPLTMMIAPRNAALGKECPDP